MLGIKRLVMTTYIALPPNQLVCKEYANNDVEAAGPTACTIDAVVCAIQLTPPSDLLLGAEDENRT